MKKLFIIDIQKKIDYLDTPLTAQILKSDKVVSLSPYSSYLIDNLKINYLTFHDLVSIDSFKKINLKVYSSLVENLKGYEHYFYLLRKIMIIITYQTYIKFINSYIKKMKNDGYDIIYISNKKNSYLDINKQIIINNVNNFFYKKKLFYSKYKLFLLKKNKLKYITSKLLNNNINYYLFNKYTIKHILDDDINKFIYKLKDTLVMNKMDNNFFNSLYSEILQSYSTITIKSKYKTIQNKPFTYLSNHIENIKTRLLKLNNKEIIFFQHGSYLYSGEHSRWCEILPATINLVCNEFTKQLFLSRDAKKVYTVGSIDFNYLLDSNNYNYNYDYLYITYCTDYLYTNMLYSNINEDTSIGGDEIFLRHKAVIELFGTKFKDKKICIKIQPGIFLGTMMYVPFLELSKKYKNITIEFTIPIQNIIQKSKYIISDYFSSEFINRELHYKRDIILFQGSPLALPKDTLEDMKKMFILVDTVGDLENKVENIEDISKNRKRHDDIIEYYSSKKCDTFKLINEILKKTKY